MFAVFVREELEKNREELEQKGRNDLEQNEDKMKDGLKEDIEEDHVGHDSDTNTPVSSREETPVIEELLMTSAQEENRLERYRGH